MGGDGAGQAVIERGDVGHAAAQDDDVRVEHIDDQRQGAAGPVDIGVQAGGGLGLAGAGRGHDRLGRPALARAPPIVRRQARA